MHYIQKHFLSCRSRRLYYGSRIRPFRLNVLAPYGRRQNEQIPFLRFGDLYSATKRRNEEMKFCFGVFAIFIQDAKTKKWNFKARQNDKVTAKYQTLIRRGYLFVLSFVRFVDFQKAPKRQNDNATKLGFAAISFCRLFEMFPFTCVIVSSFVSVYNMEAGYGHFVCSFCRVIQVAKTKKWNFILAFVRFVAFHKAPKRTNEMAVSGFHIIHTDEGWNDYTCKRERFVFFLLVNDYKISKPVNEVH